MTTLRIANDYSHLITSDHELKVTISSKLRFRKRNYFMNPRYQQKLWDGYYYFFDKKNGRFLTGLLTEVSLILHYLGVKYETVDERTKVSLLYNEINDQFLNQWLPQGKSPITLEDYQVLLVNNSIKHFRGIVKAPTGSGKTFVIISTLKCLHPSTPILFLANRTQLVKQNYDEMIAWGLQRVGRFDGSVHEPNMITCATVQSAHHLGSLLPKFRALIVDEVHTMMGAQAQEIYKQLPGCSMRLGISATPFKFERKGKKNKNIMVDGDDVHKYNVKGFFGPVLIRDITTKMLQERGRLSKTKCIFFPITEPQTIKYDVYQDAVTNGISQNWHFHQVVKKLTEGLKGRVLILVERLAHGDTLNQIIPNSLWVQGKDDEDTRLHVIKQLSDSKEDVVAIATTGIFNTGLNFRVHAMVNAAGGRASHEIAQRIGRGLRPADDKEQLLYIDFVFKTHDDLLNHSEDRISILTDEGHDVIVKEQLDFAL